MKLRWLANSIALVTACVLLAAICSRAQAAPRKSHATTAAKSSSKASGKSATRSSTKVSTKVSTKSRARSHGKSRASAHATAKADADEKAAAASDDTIDTGARRHFLHGENLYVGEQYADALVEFQAGYADSSLPGFLINIAQCHRHLGDLTAARASYELFLQRAPDSPLAPAVRKLIFELPMPAAPLVVPAPEPPAPVVSPPKAVMPRPRSAPPKVAAR